MAEKLVKSYNKLSNPIAKSSQVYIDGILENAHRRKGEEQVVASVGDTVWCVFSDTPKGTVNPGTIIRIEIDQTSTVYTVLPDNSINYETFLGEDFGEIIFTEDSMEKRTILVKPSCFAPEVEMVVSIPDNRDAEEYIDELLDRILSEEFKNNIEWDFVDGIS